MDDSSLTPLGVDEDGAGARFASRQPEELLGDASLAEEVTDPAAA